MEIVQDAEFLHIHRPRGIAWETGSQFFFGDNTTAFVQAFDHIEHKLVWGKGRSTFTNAVAKHVVQVASGEAEKNPEAAKTYHYDPVKCLQETNTRWPESFGS